MHDPERNQEKIVFDILRFLHKLKGGIYVADQNTILMESIKRLLRRNALSHLRKIVAKTHAAERHPV